ncbi:DUF58 domain-containing protein [Euzebya sp.]|uniref:DUF58 domain-containing protein n=1 Tax=Euzebya sp. TaxID=1971409 RepID=UPI0035188BC4
MRAPTAPTPPPPAPGTPTPPPGEGERSAADDPTAGEVPTAPSGRAWPVPTWRVAAALVAVGLALLPFGTGAGVVWLVGDLVVLVACAVAWALAPAPSRIGIRREVDDVLVLDATSTLRWTIRNPVGRALVVDVADALPGSLRVGDRRGRLVVPARGRRSAAREVTPARRGTIGLGAITLRVHGPLGLVMRQADVDVARTIRVHPAFPSRDTAELALQQARRQAEGLRTVRLRGQGTDFESLREYTPDDESRRIDWAATARALKPIVRTYRAERNQHVLILLDHGRTMAGRMGRDAVDDDVAPGGARAGVAPGGARAGVAPGGARAGVAPRLEHAMDAAMALTRVATGMGDRVGLVTFADVVGASVPPRTGTAQLARITQALADVPVELVEPDYAAAFAEALVRHRRRALVVVLTDLSAAPVTESLAPAVPLLSRRHLLLVASPADPSVRAWTTRPPRDATAAYRMAAALRAEADRRRSARLLRGLGAQVVDDPPTRLPLRLIDAYLDLKAAGRL